MRRLILRAGEFFGLILPSMTVESMTVFAREFRSWLAANGEIESNTLLVLDGAGSHRSERISYGEIDKQLLPPYSPELNRVERFFQELRRELKNRVYESYEEVGKSGRRDIQAIPVETGSSQEVDKFSLAAYTTYLVILGISAVTKAILIFYKVGAGSL